MRPKSIWNDTFTVKYGHWDDLVNKNKWETYTETFEGSLKTLNRKVINERRHGHASVSFYDSSGVLLKNIMY